MIFFNPHDITQFTETIKSNRLPVLYRGPANNWGIKRNCFNSVSIIYTQCIQKNSCNSFSMDFSVFIWPPQLTPSCSWNISLKQNCKDEKASTQKPSLVWVLICFVSDGDHSKESSKACHPTISLAQANVYFHILPQSPTCHGLAGTNWTVSTTLSLHPCLHEWTVMTYFIY